MEYFFVPGRLKELSLVELDSVCKNILGFQYDLSNQGQYFILKTDLDKTFVEKVFLRLGGFLKYGEILDAGISIQNLVGDKKITFGISSYDDSADFEDIKKLSHNFKTEFLKTGKKVRFVLPRSEKYLSASQVLNNKLISEGIELVILKNQMGRTLGVQDIESFSARDYKKPYVDSKMGVLPIKLSRIMINLAGIKQGGSLWDPFCGSGNILLEGLDMGYDVLGSDIDTEAIQGAKKNVSWAKKTFKYDNNANLFYLDIQNPTRSKVDILEKSKIDGIVCEPYMGKPQRKLLEVNDANSLVRQHYSLVESLFAILDVLNLEKKIKVVVIFPEYKTKKGWISVKKDQLNFKGTKLIQKDLHWSRENSIIKRLIFVFEYKSR